MKIGIVTEYYYPTLGGIQEHVYNFTLEAIALGHDVRIITSNIYDIRDDGSMTGNAPIIRIGIGVPIYQNGSVARITFSPFLGNKLEKLFDREQFDVIHVHAPLTPTLPILSVTRSNTVTVGTFHTNFTSSNFLVIFNKACQSYLDRMDGLVAVSKTAAAALDRYFNATFTIIPNGVDTRRFNPETPKLPLFDDGKFNILWVGRMEPRNGLDRMIRSFLHAFSVRNDLRLIVIGDGSLRSTYEAMIPENMKPHVHFTGFVNTGRPPIYSSCHLLCVPATISSFGITVLEGMATQIPVIASDIDGFRDIMTNDAEGMLIDTANVIAFKDAILKIAGDRELAGRYGACGRQTALRYSWPSVTKQVLDYYKTAADYRKVRIKRKSG